MLTAYAVFFGIPYLFHTISKSNSNILKEGLRSVGIEETTLSWGAYGGIYLFIILALFSIYAASLFNTNQEQIRRQQIKMQTAQLKWSFTDAFTKNKDKNILKIIIFSLATLFIISPYMNMFIVYLVLAASAGFMAVVIFNRRFKVFKLFSMDNKKCRPWDLSPSKADAEDSSISIHNKGPK
jgi:hypothetical protein